MKIIHLSYQYSPHKDPEAWVNGFRFFYRIWERLAGLNDIIFIDFIDYEGRLVHHGIQHWFLSRKTYNLFLPFTLHGLIKKEHPDVVVIHGLMSPLQVLLLAFQLGKKTKVVVQHHAEQPFRNGLKVKVQQLVDGFVNAYFFTGKDHATAWIKAGLIRDAGKVKEIMEATSVFQPTDKKAARIEVGINAAHAYLWIGHLNANKNPVLALDAFVRFVSQDPQDADLYMIFQSDELLGEIKKRLAQQSVAAEHIHLVGKLPHAELQSWFSAADFIVSTSSYEGSSVAVCEGMSCGCIPILTDIPSFRFMTGRQCGILYEAGDEDALVAAFLRSADLDKAGERQKTLQQYSEHLSAIAIAERIQEEMSSL